MRIIEQNIVPKSPKAKAEDGIVITDDFIAVIDGSTSKSPARVSRWKTNGRYCMQLVCKYIKHIPKDITAEQFCSGVTQYIRKKYKTSQIAHLAEHPEDRLTASCIIYSRLQRQIWMIGDCQCMIGDIYYNNPKPCEKYLAEKRATIAHELLDSNTKTVTELRQCDTARNLILPEMIQDMHNQNITYSVIDGFPIPMNKTRIISLDFSPWRIVLASDGYPILRTSLKDSEDELHRQLDSDPLNIKTFKATKGLMLGNNSFDDRAYISFYT